MMTSPWLSVTAAAFAQGSGSFVQAQSHQTGMHQADDAAAMVQPLNVSVGDLEEMEIYGAAGDKVGEVDAVLVDGSGQPVAVAAAVGGFLGMDQRDVVLGLDQLRKDGDRLTVAMSKEQMEVLQSSTRMTDVAHRRVRSSGL
jgi:sporulation protein YlmC with PRC-barrel domain